MSNLNVRGPRTETKGGTRVLSGRGGSRIVISKEGAGIVIGKADPFEGADPEGDMIGDGGSVI